MGRPQLATAMEPTAMDNEYPKFSLLRTAITVIIAMIIFFWLYQEGYVKAFFEPLSHTGDASRAEANQ
jgi:hypothetical protein